MESLLLSLPVLIFSIVLHEVAHGWAALKQGDPTAAMLGRITLNPIPHIDPVGSILVPVVLSLMPGGFIFGWAKPVPVNPRNFRDYKRGDIIVSLAGIVVNLILAVLFTLLLVAAVWLNRAAPDMAASWSILQQMAQFGVIINLILALFNLLPIPPLDGSHVFYHMLPPHLGMRYRELGRFGMLFLLLFLFVGGFRVIEIPLVWLSGMLFGVASLLI